jgi:hypothetical protein
VKKICHLFFFSWYIISEDHFDSQLWSISIFVMSANIKYKGQHWADHSACVATNVLVTLLCASCFYQNADLVIIVCLKFGLLTVILIYIH